MAKQPCIECGQLSKWRWQVARYQDGHIGEVCEKCRHWFDYDPFMRSTSPFSRQQTVDGIPKAWATVKEDLNRNGLLDARTDRRVESPAWKASHRELRNRRGLARWEA